MSYEPYYWLDDKEAPFAELLSVVHTQCHPEAHEDAYDDLIKLAREPKPYERIVSREQLVAAIRDPSQIPAGALSQAGEYDDGSEEKFLHRLWRDLYPNEPLPKRS